MENSNNIISILESIIRKVLGDESIEIGMNTKASDVSDWDSLAHITILVNVEKYYNMKFSLNELQNMNDISDLVKLINDKKSN